MHCSKLQLSGLLTAPVRWVVVMEAGPVLLSAPGQEKKLIPTSHLLSSVITQICKNKFADLLTSSNSCCDALKDDLTF